MKKTYLNGKLLLTVILLLCNLFGYCQTLINQEKFETAPNVSSYWTLGTATRVNTTPANSYNGGSFYMRLVGGNTLESRATGIDITAYDKIDVKFFVNTTTTISANETFVVQYRDVTTTGTYQTIRTVTMGNSGTPRDINSLNTHHAITATIFKSNITFGALSQFRIVSNLNVARIINIDNISITGTTFTNPTLGPGGVTANLETWLKADKINGTGVNSNNTSVDTWQDVGRGNDASVIDAENLTLTNRPSFRNNPANNVNFNPVVYFNNDNSSTKEFTGLTNRAELNATGGFFSQDQFIVVINENGTTLSSTSGVRDIFCGQEQISSTFEEDISGIGFGNYSLRLVDEIISYCVGNTGSTVGTPPQPNPDENLRGYGIAQTGTATYTNFIGIVNARQNTATSPTAQQLFNNGLSISNKEVGIPNYRSYSNRRFWLGRSQAFNGSFNGRVAEVITYSARKNDASERRRIESYLAIKYGITLGTNGISMDYQNSDGNVIWSQSGNVGYNFNIAGIGRNDLAELNQKQSRSSNSTAEVAIGLGEVATTNTANTNTFSIDKSFLVWGSNDLPLALTGATTTAVTLGASITTNFIPAQRKYKIVETGGDVAQTVLSIPQTSFSGLTKTATQEYVLIVSATANFASADIIDIVPMKRNGSNYETWYDFDGTKFFTFGVANPNTTKYRIENDNTDFIVGEKDVNLNSTFTVSAWIRTTASNGYFISKVGAYQFYVNSSNKIVGNWNGADRITSNTSVNTGKWHYISITYTPGTANLYIDGVLDKTVSVNANPVSNTNNFAIGGIWTSKSAIANRFIGDIDEIRIWNSQLSDVQLRYIMNQEILKNGTSTFGAVIPNSITKNDILTIPWSNLAAYYDINTLYGTSIKDQSDNNYWARIKYLATDNNIIASQTAPLPYQSTAAGLWQNDATWTNGSVQNIANSQSIVNNTISVNWNIVQTQNAVNSQGNKTVLGLLVASNTLSATNDSKIEVSHYLDLDGKIDLVGESQLIQTLDSDLDVTSAGSIERDQQGTKTIYDYNYWCSPVGNINTTSNNTNYTVNSVFKDGTTATPTNINWVSGYNGSPTSPISLASYWIFKYQSAAADYANWIQTGPNGTLNVAQGFTLKGSGAATADQNYTFVGKPNNGLIQFTINPNLINLTGNPYTSALDAQAFITANSSSTTGTLYFWDHFGGGTHNLLGYQGGYATYNNMGGVVAMSHPVLQNVGPGTKQPKRYVPVGQGFFIQASATGGNVIFNNTQRGFFKEDGINSIMFRNGNQTSSLPEANHFLNNSEDEMQNDNQYLKVRLGYNTKDDYHRQVLLGFANEKATGEIDPGYDAITLDDQENDMYFLHGDKKLIIQGDGFFNPNNNYPIGLKSSGEGTVKFMIDQLENFDESQQIYIYDATTAIYHNIKNNIFQIELPEGVFNERFSLRFTNGETLGTENPMFLNGIQVTFTSNNNVLHIKNNVSDTTVISATLFNLLGQKLATNNVENQTQNAIQIPIFNVSTGTYLVKIHTTNGDVSTKIIIK